MSDQIQYRVDIIMGSISIHKDKWISNGAGGIGQQYWIITRNGKGEITEKKLHEPCGWLYNMPSDLF